MPSNPLTVFDREEIRAGIERKDPDEVIAAGLGRHRCTINAEIRRNGGRKAYSAVSAAQRAVCERKRPKTPKLIADPGLAREVGRRLKAKDSPKRISIELAAEGHHISHECIYQAIYNPESGLESGCHHGLHLRRQRRKHRGRTTPGGHSLGEFNPISARPAIADERVEVGHLEGDLIVGAMNRSAIITVFDRTTRYLWLQKLGSKSADDTFTAMLILLTRIPARLRLTMTWDQGAEIARWAELTRRRNIDIYIADPKAPWQRPTNENGNALVRRYVGKGTDLSIYTTRQLRHIEQRINTIPRPTLNWATAHDIYTHTVAMTR